MKKPLKTALLIIFAANAIIIAGFWWKSAAPLFATDTSGALLALGRLFGLFAVLSVLMQFLFMGRASWLEHLFGLDKLARIHRINGYTSMGLIIMHITSLTVSYALFNKVSLISQYLDFLWNFNDVAKAAIAFGLFVVIVISSIIMSKMKLNFEIWYLIHLTTYVAVILAFGHQIAIGGTLLGNPLFKNYWLVLYAFIFVNLIFFRFFRPAYRSITQSFVVDRIESETSSSFSIYIRGKNLKKWKSEPGQFIIVRFLAKKFWREAHPFSLSSIPKNNELRITVKKLGDFTNKLDTVKKGTKVLVEGPYGAFTPNPNADKYLFIAGGVGITPIRAMMEQLAPQKDVILLYSNKNSEDAIFRKELDEIAAEYPVKIHFIMTDEEKFTGEKGRLDEEKIRKLVPDVKEREIYICGPVPMIHGLTDCLTHKMAVAHHRVHYEKFSF